MVLRTTNAASARQLHQTLTNFVALAGALTATNPELRILLEHLIIAPQAEAVNLSVIHPTRVNGKSIYAGVIDTARDKTTPAPAPGGSQVKPSEPVAPPPNHKKGVPEKGTP